jgi:PhzF family phenazine biosynthesis protein
VVLGADGWPVERMQAQAAQFGAETAFVLTPDAGGDVRLRYFVPRHEMEMCVHATVAATIVLGQAGRLPRSPASVETPIGRLDVTWDAAASTATVEQLAPRFGPELSPDARGRLLAALGITVGDLATDAGPVRSVSTARPKLMIALRSEAVLDALVPDFAALWSLCEELEVTGCYPFTLQVAGAEVAARQFPVRAGYVEDPATGVAACALGAHLAVGSAAGEGWQRRRIAQGRAMGRPSLIIAESFVDGTGAVTATRVGGAMQRSEAPAVRL